MMTRIEAKYLTKVYKNGDYALKNCSLSVKGGEFLVILGGSGAGKSTLLKVLAGTEKLSSGELYFDGILSDNISVSKRDVSMVFQEYVLYPHMTVFDNLATPLKLAGEDEKSIYDRVTDALRLFNLEIAADVKPKNLSGGEQQRVALAKVFLKKSKLVLLDEPMSNIDEKSRWEYCKALKTMKQMLPNSSFVYVTHNTREALFLADRIAIMNDGAISQIASRDFLLRNFDSLNSMEIMGASENVFTLEYDGEHLLFNGGIFEKEPTYIDYSSLSKGQSIVGVQNALYNELVHIFDEDGNSLSLSSKELKIKGNLMDNTLSFADREISLDNEYLSRLIYLKEDVDVVMLADKFSKTQQNNSFSLVFEVEKNGGDHVVLSVGEDRFILNRKTDLEAGERIRLYYKIEELILFDGKVRLTSHYPLHRRIKIGVFDASGGKFTVLGKRIKLNKSIPSYAKFAVISEDAFELSYEKGRCSVKIDGCLHEEFINGQKIIHVAIKGEDSYLSFIADEEIGCFTKRKVYLNINPSKIRFEERK